MTKSPKDDERFGRGAVTEEELAAMHVFRRVSGEAVLGLLEQNPVVTLEEGEVLLRKGDTNQKMFVVLSGALSIRLDSSRGETVALLRQGETVGELSVIGDAPASAFVVAHEYTRLLPIGEETFWRLVQSSHEFATNLLLLLAQRMTASNTAIESESIRRRELELEVNADALTGLNNRRWLDRNLPRFIKRHAFDGNPLCVMMVDVDHFKKFNDQYGHLSGDVVLAEVASTLRANLRPTDLAARYGGEEFTVILPNTNLAGAAVAAERLRQAVAEARFDSPDGQRLPQVTISLGIADLGEGQDAAALIERADGALYRAKENGRNRVET